MAEYCIRGATKDGKVLFIRRRFVSKSAAEKYPIRMSSWGSAMGGEQTFVRSVKADSPDGFGNVEIVVSGTFMTSVPCWLVGIL
jgi:hypothetical protein